MSWWIIGVMAFGAYAFKALGLFALSRVELKDPFGAIAEFLPAALFASIIVQQTFATGSTDEVITRVVGVAAGGVAVWRKAPLMLVIVLAAGTTAALRALT